VIPMPREGRSNSSRSSYDDDMPVDTRGFESSKSAIVATSADEIPF
jgi:hypothetical protein